MYLKKFPDKHFSKFQRDFKKGCSTQQCIIVLNEKWKSALDSGKYFGDLLSIYQNLLTVLLKSYF